MDQIFLILNVGDGDLVGVSMGWIGLSSDWIILFYNFFDPI
jgi:hypothetical protein